MRYLNKNLTDAKNVDVILKDNCDDAKPVIVLSNGALNKAYNYIYLPTFNRYYAVESKEYSQQKIILHLIRDAKTSFNTELLNCKCIASRSENRYNTYLNDAKYSRLQYSQPVLKQFTGGTNFDKELSPILIIAGGA